MAAVQAVVLCVAGALVCVLLRVQKPEFRMAVSLAAALAALSLMLPELEGAAQLMGLLSAQSGMGDDSLKVLFRSTGIALLAEAGAQICRDADEQALAGRIELAARVVLLSMTAPLLTALMQDLTELMSG